MPLLFSYGTLQREDVQLQLYGRVVALQRDQLVGFECLNEEIRDLTFAATSGSSRHRIVRFTGDESCRLAGMTLELTESELTLTDAYEPEPYRRVETVLASGKRAWVYAAVGGGQA